MTDFSFALINCILSSWNNISLSDYLNKTYKIIIIEQDSLENAPYVIVKLCCAHMIKNISRNVQRSRAQNIYN